MTTENGVVVRAAVPADIPAVGRLGALLVRLHHELDPVRFFPATSRTASGYGEYLGGQLGQPETVMLVAERDGVVVGYLWGAVEGTDYMALRGPGGVVYDVVVDPAERGQGIGSRLLETGIGQLARRGAKQFTLSTAARNTGAQRLFERSGFRATMVEMTRDIPAS